MKLKIIGGVFSVCKVRDFSLVNFKSSLVFTAKTPDENSLVCLSEDVPANALKREDGFKAFCIEGELDFSLTGILAEISGVLAEKGISIFAVSTYNTDYVFIKEKDIENAVEALCNAGFEV